MDGVPRIRTGSGRFDALSTGVETGRNGAGTPLAAREAGDGVNLCALRGRRPHRPDIPPALRGQQGVRCLRGHSEEGRRNKARSGKGITGLGPVSAGDGVVSGKQRGNRAVCERGSRGDGSAISRGQSREKKQEANEMAGA